MLKMHVPKSLFDSLTEQRTIAIGLLLLLWTHVDSPPQRRIHCDIDVADVSDESAPL
jgi:hypothetical protein